MALELRRPSVRALGTSVEVDIGEVDRGVFEQAWARCLSSEATASATGAMVGPRSTMTALTQAITHELISQRRGELLMFHAGAVCHPQTGASIAYVAPGGTGKTTLSRLLGQHFGYLTDETVGVEPATWRIHAYPKPLSTRTAEGGFPKSEVGPDQLGLLPAHPAPVLRHLVLLRRDQGLVEPRWTRLELFDAIVALAPETSSLNRLERPLHLLADLYAALGGIWLVEYAEAGQIVDEIAERLG